MEIKIGEIPYLNLAPFYWNRSVLEDSGIKFQWVKVSPKDLGELAREKKIDAGPVSLVDSFEVEKDYEELSSLGISAKKSAQSVILFSKKPLQILSIDGCSIGLTEESATSVRLLKLIFEGRYGIHAEFHQDFKSEDDARLLIGNVALSALLDSEYMTYYPCRIDLGEEWFNWQRLPFVFARWMIRKDLDPVTKKKIQKFLVTNISLSHNCLDKVAADYKNETKIGFPWGKEYLSGFNYVLGEREKKSIKIFRSMISREIRPIR